MLYELSIQCAMKRKTDFVLFQHVIKDKMDNVVFDLGWLSTKDVYCSEIGRCRQILITKLCGFQDITQ